ncbi:lipase family protein [Sorangium sp. So ce131]|uniref:lipase family protein n=1 Tax=Sorangium sp. So ce131 TaxID=3133282 RepID=UPI003F5FDD60
MTDSIVATPPREVLGPPAASEPDAAIGPAADQGMIQRLLRVDPALGEPDAEATLLLSLASAWMYSDPDTLMKAMAVYGEWDIQRVSVQNNALFLASDVSFIQSRCRRLLILCIKGTEPGNIFNWLTDASVASQRFFALGRVHGGFANNIEVMWDVIARHLDAALRGRNVQDVLPVTGGCPRPDDGSSAGAASSVDAGATPEAPGKLEAFYITGHSLGAAMALLAAARLFTDGRYGEIRRLLRGVYTFGQPMVGDSVFAARARELFGDRLFRFVYANDIVPRLPPLSTGRFTHVGREYRSAGEGWTYESKAVSQTRTILVSAAVGVFAWVKQQLPIISWIPVPFSWGDHSPANYVRASQQGTSQPALFRFRFD